MKQAASFKLAQLSSFDDVDDDNMMVVLLCSNLVTQVGGFKLKFDLRRPRLQRLVLAEVNSLLRLVLVGEELNFADSDDQN